MTLAIHVYASRCTVIHGDDSLACAWLYALHGEFILHVHANVPVVHAWCLGILIVITHTLACYMSEIGSQMSTHWPDSGNVVKTAITLIANHNFVEGRGGYNDTWVGVVSGQRLGLYRCVACFR